MQQEFQKRLFSSVKVMVLMAMFIALSVVFGKFLSIPIGTSYQISFENLTVILSGIMFGPFAGFVVGVTADLLGGIMKGYSIIPLITVAAGANGLIAGVLKYVIKGRSYPKILAITLITHAIGSVAIKSAALAITYPQPWQPLVAGRTLIYIVTAAVEAFFIYILYKKKVMK